MVRNGTMTKAKFKALNVEMARFLIALCIHSDKVWGARRGETTERHYRRAIRLIRRAGLNYKPPHTGAE